MSCSFKAFSSSMTGGGVNYQRLKTLQPSHFSSAGCERTASAPLHRLSDWLPFPPQLLIRDVSEEPGGAHGNQEQHEETQLHDQADQGQLGRRRCGVLRLPPQDRGQLCADRRRRRRGEVEMCVCVLVSGGNEWTNIFSRSVCVFGWCRRMWV